MAPISHRNLTGFQDCQILILEIASARGWQSMGFWRFHPVFKAFDKRIQPKDTIAKVNGGSFAAYVA
jgi:hypothetical protein